MIIQALRRKLIFSTMLVIFLLLFCTSALINIFSSLRMNLEADVLLDRIAYNYMMERYPEDGEIYGALLDQEVALEQAGDSSGDSAGGPEEFDVDALNQRIGFDIKGRHQNIFSFLLPDIKPEDVAGAMYYTVTLDPAGNVLEADVTRTMDSENYAGNMAITLFRENKRTGWLEKCKYLAVEDPNGNRVYFFMHRDRAVEDRHRVFQVTVLVSAGFLVVTFLLYFFLSKKMLEPVAENIEKQKSFITNASHELKTPLAIIQTNAEAMELYNGKNKWTSNIEEQVHRLSIMLNNMLTLSRADEGGVKFAAEDVDLTEIAEELVKMFTETADKKNITIFQHIEKTDPIHANRTQIIQLISIFLDNAVKYAQDGTTIEVHLYTREKGTTFETVNRVEQLPECEPERLFERFYRPDSSRYSDKPGNGIGLSAARAIATTYGGVVTCKYEGKNAIRFTLLFR